MAEALNSLFKAELIRNRGPWRGIDNLEIAVAEYIDWYNHRRFHVEIGHIPPGRDPDQLLFKPARHQSDGTGLNEPPTNSGLDTQMFSAEGAEVTKFFPIQAGSLLLTPVDPGLFGPWIGYLILLAWSVVLSITAAIVLRGRDA